MSEDWMRALFEGFFGAIAGGFIAAVIALRTTKKATTAAEAVRDRDRALEAALRFRQYVSSAISATNAAQASGAGGFSQSERQALANEAYLALKGAQFARHGDVDFKAWLFWLHDELNDQSKVGLLGHDQIAWLGKVADILEARLFELGPLSRPPRSATRP